MLVFTAFLLILTMKILENRLIITYMSLGLVALKTSDNATFGRWNRGKDTDIRTEKNE